MNNLPEFARHKFNFVGLCLSGRLLGSNWLFSRYCERLLNRGLGFHLLKKEKIL